MKKQILFDVDTGCDDAIMLAMALASDKIDVVGITTVAGNTTIEKTTDNTLALLELLNRTDVPVAKGCDRSIEGDVITAEDVHGSDGLRGLRSDFPTPSQQPIDTHATDFIVEQAYEYGSDLTIAGVAPLTNITGALMKEPNLPKIVGDIYTLGGNVWKTGNITPAATFNFYADAVAAKRVMRDANPKMVGLEVWQEAPLDVDIISSFKEQGEELDLLAELLDYASEIDEGNPTEFFLPDACITANLIDDIIEFNEYYIDVDSSWGMFHGSVLFDEHDTLDHEPNARVGVDIDVVRFQEILIETLEQLNRC